MNVVTVVGYNHDKNLGNLCFIFANYDIITSFINNRDKMNKIAALIL